VVPLSCGLDISQCRTFGARPTATANKPIAASSGMIASAVWDRICSSGRGQVAAPHQGRRRGERMAVQAGPHHVVDGSGRSSRISPCRTSGGDGAVQQRGRPVSGRGEGETHPSECRIGEAAVPGQGEPYGVGENGLDRNERGAWGGSGHWEPPGRAEARRGWPSRGAPAIEGNPNVGRIGWSRYVTTSRIRTDDLPLEKCSSPADSARLAIATDSPRATHRTIHSARL
jgi:hypothetical protein